jgi:opacity protein-like surface antigen
MRMLIIAASAIAVMAFAAAAALANPAAAQTVSPSPVVHGQNWNLGQDLHSHQDTARQANTTAGRAAIRAARQASLARHFPGTPRRASVRPAR